jgi:hypothetical protein
MPAHPKLRKPPASSPQKPKRPASKPAAPAKAPEPPVESTDVVAVIDCGAGDVFELVEHPGPGHYAINRSLNPRQLPDGGFDVSEWMCLASGIGRLSDALRATADEIDRIDLAPPPAPTDRQRHPAARQRAMNQIAVASAAALALPDAELEEARSFAELEKAASTRRSYRTAFRIFAEWCHARGLEPVPAAPEAVCAFLAAEATAGAKASTIAHRAAAIRYAHRLAGHEPPTSAETVKAVMRGIRRSIGTAPERKAPATADVLCDMLRLCPATLAGKRDRALLALGFAGAFRRCSDRVFSICLICSLMKRRCSNSRRSSANVLGRIGPPSGVRRASRRSGALRKFGLNVRMPCRVQMALIRLTMPERFATSPPAQQAVPRRPTENVLACQLRCLVALENCGLSSNKRRCLPCLRRCPIASSNSERLWFTSDRSGAGKWQPKLYSGPCPLLARDAQRPSRLLRKTVYHGQPHTCAV